MALAGKTPRAQWLTVAAFLVVGLGFLFALRALRVGAVRWQGDVEDAPAPARGPSVVQVRQLHDVLRRRLGTNPRGLPRVAHVEYDPWPDRLHVVFALEHELADMPPDEAAELRPLLDVVREVHAGGLEWGWLLVTGTAPLPAESGGRVETTVVRALFSREKLDRVDWPAVTAKELTAAADQFTVNPDLARLRR